MITLPNTSVAKPNTDRVQPHAAIRIHALLVIIVVELVLYTRL
jgi:hypothetical protein